MVSEESCPISSVIYSERVTNCDKTWLSRINTKMPNNNNNFQSDNTPSLENIDSDRFHGQHDGIEGYARELLYEICDSAVSIVEDNVVRFRDNNMLTKKQKYLRNSNRNTTVLDDEYFVPHYRRRSISECIVDENDNQKYTKVCEAINPKFAIEDYDEPQKKPKETKKRKISFNSLFSRKNKHKTKEKAEEETLHPENYDNFDHNNVPYRANSLNRSKKYASALELNHKSSSLQRTPSFIRKLVSISEDSSNFLKRSLSFRDINKKKDDDNRTRKISLTEIKTKEWNKSLQSLVENDISVSYHDLSFVNYDPLDTTSYCDSGCGSLRSYSSNRNIGRTQSMLEKRSPESRRPTFRRHLSSTPKNSTCSAEPSGALSLPSLHHLNQDNAEISSSETASPTHRYRRRPQSISSEDGGGRSRPHGNGSFRSAGSGCAKLKRHNACRQKSRDVTSLYLENRQQRNDERTVRSRSLNHLDTLEMRQGVVSSTDTALKDSRSEPDCTKPLLAPPAATQEPPTPTNEVPHPPRKHMLSRSQKSSSECFSVNFEVGDESTWENELLFPAQRGITLQESLAQHCERRGIDLSSCESRLQDKENNVETPLSLLQDTANLVGRHIRITVKETSNKKLSSSFSSNHSRKPSGSARSKASYFSTSTEEPSVVASSNLSLHDTEQSKKQIKQRLTAFFGNTKDPKLEALVDQLNKYTKEGIPNTRVYPQGQCESVDALYVLEDDWRDIINYSDLNEKQQQQQTALWELIKTEVAYIKTLKVVTDLFLACLRDLQTKNHLKEIDTDKLFSNITQILDANVVFWRCALFPIVREMRKTKQTACIELMHEGFFKMHDIFEPYDKYCAEQARCQHYCRENLDSEFFTAYLTWCESQKDCNRLRLMDILVQPMQRLTKYGLLLKAILKNSEEDVERLSLQTMIKTVDEFVNKVNSNLKHKQDKERLKGLIARIESYDIVESKDDDIEKILKKEKSLTQLDLTRPMLGCLSDRKRRLILEGDLKLKDSGASKMEVHCFLLTDMLLICKPSTKKGGATMRVVRQPYLVDRLVVSELHRETPSLAVIYKNEFDMAVAAFILQNTDAKKLRGWRDGIYKAQSLYLQAKQMSHITDESIDADYSFEHNFENEFHNSQFLPRSPLASSSRASRVSSLAHSHSGSVEMNDQSSIGSAKDQSRGVSMDNENRTASISSDEGVQPLPPDKSPVSQKNSFKNRVFHKTPNTLSVQPFGSLGQSLPNLTLGSPNVGSLSLCLNQNTLSVPNSKNSGHLLSPTHRGISYPPPSPTRGNLRRSLAISQSKNPPLIKTRQVNSTSSVSQQIPNSFDFDVPVIAGVPHPDDHCESFSRGHHRQAMKRTYRNDKRYHTAGVVDDIKKNDSRDASIHKRLSWNCTSQEQRPPNEDQT